jgi:hypothetical protein
VTGFAPFTPIPVTHPKGGSYSGGGPTTQPPHQEPWYHSVGFSPLETPTAPFEDRLLQFHFDQLNPGPNVFLHEMGTMSQVQNVNRQSRHLFEGTIGSLQQHMSQAQISGRTPYLENIIKQEINTLKQVSRQFKEEFSQKYGPQTHTGHLMQTLLENPEEMDKLFGQSLRPSDIRKEVLAQSPDLANQPELLAEEIKAILSNRQREISRTNQNFIQARYLLDSATTSEAVASKAGEILNQAPVAPQTNIGQKLKEAAYTFGAGELVGNIAPMVAGPYTQLGRLGFYANAWQQAMPYDLTAGGTALNAGLNPNAGIAQFLATGHHQHLAAPEIAQTAGLAESFAGIQGAAFLFKNAADTYQFATYLGITPALGAQVMGQSAGGGSAQSAASLFAAIMQTGHETGLSNTAVAQGLAGMQNALTASYQSTQAAPEYTNALLNLYHGAGMTPAEARQSLSQFEGMMGTGSHLNLMSAQLFTQAYAHAHGGQIGNLSTLIANANAGRITPAELQYLMPQLHHIAMTQGQTAFMLDTQGILTPQAFGMSAVDLYKEFASPHFNPQTILNQAQHALHAGTHHPVPHPSGTFHNVLSEMAKVANLQIDAGNATINISHTAGPWVGGALGTLSGVLDTMGGVMAASLALGGLGKAGGWLKGLWGRFFGGGGGSPPDGGSGPLGGGGPLGGAGGTCSPCEENTAQAATSVARDTSAIKDALTMGALGLGGLGASAYVMSKNGQWMPNMASPAGQMASIGTLLSQDLGGLLAGLGSLVGSHGTVQPWTGGAFDLHAHPNIARWLPAIQSVSHQTGVSPSILEAVMNQESGGNPNALSSAGAIGLMQLMPGTAAALGVNPTNPQQNLLGGAKYLASLDKEFKNWQLALAAYNAGPGTVESLVKQHGDSFAAIAHFLPAQTQHYVNSISAMLTAHPAGGSSPASSPVPSQLYHYWQSYLFNAIKAPKTSHPDTPSLGSSAWWKNFFLGPSSSATHIGMGLAAGGLGSVFGEMGLLPLLGLGL